MDSLNNADSPERGVALIMVLGMVAIIAAWASTAAYEDMIALKRASNIQDEVRATMANESAYAFVKFVLMEDYKLDPNIDSLDDPWALEQPPLPIDDGMIAATIEDANRFYNLNDLVNDNGEVIPDHFTQLQTLFFNLGIDQNLVAALADWMDKNDTPYGAGGAEDSAYYSMDYKIKNARLDNWSELKLIQGFDAETLAKLKTCTAVFPSKSGATKVNINTALPDTLMALFPNMTSIDAETLVSEREQEAFSSIPAKSTYTWLDGAGHSRLSVTSDTFMLRVHASFGQANVREEFLLSRSGSKVQLIRRERLGWQF